MPSAGTGFAEVVIESFRLMRGLLGRGPEVGTDGLPVISNGLGVSCLGKVALRRRQEFQNGTDTPEKRKQPPASGRGRADFEHDSDTVGRLSPVFPLTQPIDFA